MANSPMHTAETYKRQATREVRAGPGDAGRQDRAEPLPDTPENRKRGHQAVALFAGLCVVGAVVVVVLRIAGW